nr:macrolide family glycosyltransferase [Demetria terragena]
MSTVAMFGVNAISHTLPSLEILRELVARGHRVRVVNSPDLRNLIEETGAELIPCQSTLPHEDWPSDPIASMRAFFDDAAQGLAQVRAVLDAEPADLYLADIGGYGGRVLAEAHGRPFVQLSPTYVAWEGYAEEIGHQVASLPGAGEYAADFGAWLREQGAKTIDAWEFSGVPPQAIAMIPRALQPHADRVDAARISFVGPCTGDRLSQGEWQRPVSAERVVLVSLGSSYTDQPEFYRQCLAAFGGLPEWHVVLQIGKHVDPAVLGDVPENVEVHRWIPQVSVLAQADLFVTHAGMGGASEGLSHAVPMIAVPQDVDQFTNADTLVELGVARRIDTDDATAQRLRDAAGELLTEPVAARLRTLADAARGEGGTARAVDILEDALRTR